MLAFSNDYYGLNFRAKQSVELFCAYSLSIYDFGWIGPIVVPFIIGGTISLLEGHFRGKRRDAYHWSIYSGLIMSFFRIVNYCEMQDIALSLFPYIVIFFVAHFIQLVTGQRRKRDKSTQRF